MGKAKRKPRPQPPKWYWLDSDDCWCCKNRNNCNQCKRLKQLDTELKKQKEKFDYRVKNNKNVE